VSNGWMMMMMMIVSMELERIWKSAVVTYVNVLQGNLPEMTEKYGSE
jgi:hypothetical protein